MKHPLTLALATLLTMQLAHSNDVSSPTGAPEKTTTPPTKPKAAQSDLGDSIKQMNAQNQQKQNMRNVQNKMNQANANMAAQLEKEGRNSNNPSAIKGNGKISNGIGTAVGKGTGKTAGPRGHAIPPKPKT